MKTKLTFTDDETTLVTEAIVFYLNALADDAKALKSAGEAGAAKLISNDIAKLTSIYSTIRAIKGNKNG